MDASLTDQRDPLERLPGWAPLAFFAVVTLLLFRDFVFSDQMLLGQDTFSLGYVARAFFADAIRSGGFPLWNPHILGGTPFLESLAGGDSLYPPSLALLFLTETYRALGWKLVLHVFLAGSFMFLWLRVLGGSKGGALIGGTAYLLAPYLVSLVYPGHDGKLFVTALTPLLFAAVEVSFSRRSLVAAAGVGAVVAAVILTTHFQMAYFLFGAVGIYAAFRSVQLAKEEKRWSPAARRFGVFLLFSVLGAGAAGVQLIPAVDYVTEYSRRTMTTTDSDPETARAYSASWSLHPEEAVGLVVPEFVGSNVGGAAWTASTYWGRNPFKHNHEYLGLVALLLAGISFMGAPRRGVRWCLVGLGGLGLLFALGTHTPIWGILYELLPGISLFRAPSIAIFLTGFAVATLAGLGVDRGIELVREGEGAKVARLTGGAAVGLGVAWLLAVTGALESLWFSLFSGALTEGATAGFAAARPYIGRGFLTATVLACATAAIWWGMHRRTLAVPLGVTFLVLLIAVDEYRIDAPFIQVVDHGTFWSPDAGDELLVEASGTEDPFRVLSLVRGGQDVDPAIHGLELAAGHHPNDLARYRELIGMYGSGLPENLVQFHPNVMRILNIRYVVWPDADYGPFPFEGVEPVMQLAVPGGDVVRSIYAYPGFPRARLVGEVLVVPEERTLEVLLDDAAYDPEIQAIVSEELSVELAGGPVDGTVTWVERTPNRLVVDVTADAPALLVVAENWFPAWKASVDGSSTPVVRADHALRSVPVPAGSHRVELTYRSRLVAASLGVSLACALVLLGCALTPYLRGRRSAQGDAAG